MENESDIVFRLRKRAEIRRGIPGRKSVQAGEPDRIADLLDEAAEKIGSLRGTLASARAVVELEPVMPIRNTLLAILKEEPGDRQ